MGNKSVIAWGGLNLFAFFFFFSFALFAQVGIGTTDPKSALDVNGALSLREGPALILTNNDNVNIDLGATIYSVYRILGPTNDFKILSFNTPSGVSANNGQLLTLINTTPHKMTIVHNQGSGGEQQRRIYCPSGQDFDLEGENSTITLQYNSLLERWVINSHTDIGGYGKNMHNKVGTSDIDTNSDTASDMADMDVTFTPKHSTVFVNFTASGTMDEGGGLAAQGFANFELKKDGITIAGATTLASDRSYEPIETSSSSIPSNCREMFYDSGGATNDYGYSENTTWTYTPTVAGEKISVEFLTFNTEYGYDGLMIYDGPNISSPIIPSGFVHTYANHAPDNAWTGPGIGSSAHTAAGRVFTSTHSSGALTFRFISDGSVNYPGWEGCVTLGDPPPPDPCLEMFYDRGGATGNYPNGDTYTKLYTPTNAGEKVSIKFTSFDTESGWDGLMIYDGPNASSPLISSGYTYGSGTCPDGAWSGTSTYSAVGKTFTSSAPGGELYFVFRSDSSVNYSGWVACVKSIIPIPLDCIEIFYDSGGAGGNYPDYDNYTRTFTPVNSGEKVSVEFLTFNTEQNYDGLMIYDGPDTSSPLISSGYTGSGTYCPNGAWTGTGTYSAEGKIFTSSAPGGELTFVFKSDVSGNRSGWKACVNSVTVYRLETAWNAGFMMYPVNVTPGVETTIKIQWSRDSTGGPPGVLRNNVSSDVDRSHRSLTIFD